MRVLYIDSVCKSGSTGKIVYALYTAVNENGGEAAVCYGRGAELREKNIYKLGDGAARGAHPCHRADGLLLLFLHAAFAALYGRIQARHCPPA